MSTFLQRKTPAVICSPAVRLPACAPCPWGRKPLLSHAACHMHCLCRPFLFHTFPSAEQKNRGHADKSVLRDTCSIICLVQILYQ